MKKYRKVSKKDKKTNKESKVTTCSACGKEQTKCKKVGYVGFLCKDCHMMIVGNCQISFGQCDDCKKITDIVKKTELPKSSWRCLSCHYPIFIMSHVSSGNLARRKPGTGIKSDSVSLSY